VSQEDEERKLKYRLQNLLFPNFHDQAGQQNGKASDLIQEVPSLYVERRIGSQTVSRGHLYFQYNTLIETTGNSLNTMQATDSSHCHFGIA
jgi:hypothetical protein